MQQRLAYLLEQFISNAASPKELIEFETLIASGEHEDALKELMDQVYQADQLPDKQNLSPYFPVESSSRMLNNILNAAQPAPTAGPARSLKLWTKGFIAAAIATIILSGIMFVNRQPDGEPAQTLSKAMDIGPGTSGATLTLASGKTIALSDKADGEIAREAGVTITKDNNGMLVYEIQSDNAKAGAINTLSTAKGETYAVVLPDKSKVWLNAASTLKYPANFAKEGNRTVALLGEGYFEVTKDKAHPFVVTTELQQVEVLGTHFNISSYPEDKLKTTTLLEGSVRIHPAGTSANTSFNLVLKPNEEAILSNGKVQKVNITDASAAIDWKEGYFKFDTEEFTQIMRKIARWYNVDIHYEGGEARFEGLTYGGFVSRSRNISAVLAIFEQTDKVNFVIQGKRIIVKENKVNTKY